MKIIFNNMFCNKNQQSICYLFHLILILLFFPVTAFAQSTGTISGLVVYKYLTGKKPSEPMQNVKIVLCRVPDDKGLPEGPVAATSNKGKVETICALRSALTAVTDSDGRFTLSRVPVGTYLVVFHLWPSKLDASVTDWNGMAVTEAVLSDAGNDILASGKSTFWEKGGLPAVLASWDLDKGFTATQGSVCSNSWGFCFSLREKRPHPIVKVQPDSTVEVVLPIYIAPKERNR